MIENDDATTTATPFFDSVLFPCRSSLFFCIFLMGVNCTLDCPKKIANHHTKGFYIFYTSDKAKIMIVKVKDGHNNFK